MLSRNAYEMIAEAVGRGAVHGNVVACLCHVFKKENPRFDEERFTTIINRTIRQFDERYIHVR